MTRNGVTLALFTALLLGAAPALAQQATFPVVNFKPTANPNNSYVTEGGRLLPHLTPTGTLLLNYAHQPLRMIDPADDDFSHGLVNYQFSADLLLAIGLWDRLEVGLVLPVTLVQGSDGLQALGRSPGATLSGGLGDLRLVPKVRFLTKKRITQAMSAGLSFPTGSDEDLLGDDGVTFTPHLIGSYDTDRFSVALNVGYRFRNSQSFFAPGRAQQVTIDDEVPMAVGGRVNVWKKLDVIADLFWAISTEEQDKEEIPLELLTGVRYGLPHNLVANLGLGFGLTQGIGTPVVRVIGGLAYQHAFEREKAPAPKPTPVDLDPDKDGILGADDACPNDPEDKDDFEDSDGCPEADNDKDGILDAADKCPNEPEDKDGFEDADGCPDLDNDKDGILDAADKCPLKPEDKDGFEDADGCPDEDNDKDGIKDVDDKCPLEPEIFNGVDDADGCPDKGKGPVQIQQGKITVPPVFFATAKDRVLRRSLPMLKLVAQTLMKNAWVKRVRIEGHTDDRGKDSFNLDLSQRRADKVKEHLAILGVSPDRLESKGFGETMPISSNKRARGRAKNRRVMFIIVDPPTANPASPGPP
jgi:outer membrane protein OmpA-like peptidoglycan-associated protein